MAARSRSGSPDADAAVALLREELRPGDVVLFKSSRDAGLRWLGDRLAAGTEGRRQRVKAVLIAAVVVARASRCSAPRCSSGSWSARATASSSATTDRPRTTPSAARPTMGGAVIIGALARGLRASRTSSPGTPPTVSGLLVLFLMTGLGLVGFLDDFIKISKQRSLGLRSGEKLAGQTLVAVIFAVLALQFPNERFRTPASTHISFVRDTALDLAFAGALVGLHPVRHLGQRHRSPARRNGVNLTDGLDGLATGASVMVFARLRPHRHLAVQPELPDRNPGLKCYEVRDPHDLAVVAAAAMGACFGFLWWNASPAKIFMGDTGSLALGGALAGLAIPPAPSCSSSSSAGCSSRSRSR